MRFNGLVCPIDGNQPGPTSGIYGILRTVVGRHVTGFPTLEAATKSQGRSSILKALNAPYALIIDRLLRWPAGSFAVINRPRPGLERSVDLRTSRPQESSSTARGLTKQYCFGFVRDDRLPIDLTSALVGTRHRRPRSYGPEPTLQMRKLV